jgi:lipid-A-disaccharide synthase
MLAVMLSIVEDFPDYQFVAGAPSQEFSFMKVLTNKNIKFISNKTYDLLKIATAALVTSGTATLETALSKFQRSCVIKEVGLLTKLQNVITLKYISLVNLIMDEEVVRLIQEDFNTKENKIELQRILEPNHRTQLLQKYENIRKKTGWYWSQ